MKKFIVASFVVAALFGCGGNESKEAKEETKETVPDVTQNPDYQKGLALVADPKNNCLTCHKVDEPLTGPPYREVAKKYADRGPEIVDTLAKKVISGGMGNWGQVPMVPHPGLSMDDARAMVKYILLLKK
jgi:cytochrome c